MKKKTLIILLLVDTAFSFHSLFMLFLDWEDKKGLVPTDSLPKETIRRLLSFGIIQYDLIIFAFSILCFLILITIYKRGVEALLRKNTYRMLNCLLIAVAFICGLEFCLSWIDHGKHYGYSASFANTFRHYFNSTCGAVYLTNMAFSILIALSLFATNRKHKKINQNK